MRREPSAPGAAADANQEEPTFEPDPANWEAPAGAPNSWPTQQVVWFEWEHVRDRAGQPLRVPVNGNNILHHGRRVPGHPLASPHGSRGLLFSLDFMAAVAERVAHYGIQSTYAGVVYEGDKLEFSTETLPDGGIDIADHPVFWRLPGGRVVCWSVRRLLDARPDELAGPDEDADYHAVAKTLGFKYLGAPRPPFPERPLLLEPGTLADRRWEELHFARPDTALAECYWLTNPPEKTVPLEEQKETPARFVNRSLAILTAEIHQNRVATIGKLYKEVESRKEKNAKHMSTVSGSPFWRKHGPRVFVEAFLPCATTGSPLPFPERAPSEGRDPGAAAARTPRGAPECLGPQGARPASR